MDLFMPAERVLYDRAYYLSDEAERDYAFEVAEEHGVDVGEVLYSDELMEEVHDALDRDIDLYLDDEIANFDSILRGLKRGEDPEHPAEISVVAMGSVGRWDGPSRGLVAANSLRDLIDGKGSADALVDCQIDRIVDTNGTFSIEASHHDGTAYLDVRLISGVSFDGKGFRLGGERYAPGKMDLDDFHILLGNLYDAPGVGPCSLPHFAERAYGTAQKSYRFGETVFDIYRETGGTDRPYKVMVSAGETAGNDAGARFASAEEAKAWCYRYSMRELADIDEPKPGPEFFRERHSKTRPIVCLETGETFDGNPAAARPLHVSPATISQAVRYGTPVAGLHFYHGDEPKPAPEFFKPIKPERGKSPMQMAAAARAAAGNPGRPDGGQRPRRAV